MNNEESIVPFQGGYCNLGTWITHACKDSSQCYTKLRLLKWINWLVFNVILFDPIQFDIHIILENESIIIWPCWTNQFVDKLKQHFFKFRFLFWLTLLWSDGKEDRTFSKFATFWPKFLCSLLLKISVPLIVMHWLCLLIILDWEENGKYLVFALHFGWPLLVRHSLLEDTGSATDSL